MEEVALRNSVLCKELGSLSTHVHNGHGMENISSIVTLQSLKYFTTTPYRLCCSTWTR